MWNSSLNGSLHHCLLSIIRPSQLLWPYLPPHKIWAFPLSTYFPAAQLWGLCCLWKSFCLSASLTLLNLAFWCWNLFSADPISVYQLGSASKGHQEKGLEKKKDPALSYLLPHLSASGRVLCLREGNYLVLVASGSSGLLGLGFWLVGWWCFSDPTVSLVMLPQRCQHQSSLWGLSPISLGSLLQNSKF